MNKIQLNQGDDDSSGDKNNENNNNTQHVHESNSNNNSNSWYMFETIYPKMMKKITMNRLIKPRNLQIQNQCLTNLS